MAWLGLSSLAMAGFVSLPTFAIVQTGAIGTALLESAAFSAAMGPVGWVVAGVLATAAVATIALIPTKIEDINQVMILSGPYNI